MSHVSWTEHAACQWDGQAHVLSAMNARARVAQRRHARFRPLAYAARSMPRGSIGSPPERGAGVYADRSGTHQTRFGHVSAPDPSLVLNQGSSISCFGIPGPYRWRSGPLAGGFGLHPKDPAYTRGGPGPPCVQAGPLEWDPDPRMGSGPPIVGSRGSRTEHTRALGPVLTRV